MRITTLPINQWGPRIRSGRHLILPPSCKDDCGKPKDLDPENPWDMISKAQKWLTCIEDENINSILDGKSSFDPNEARHRMFQAIMLMSYGYMYEKFKKDKEEENKKALKETYELAFAAR